MKGYLFVVILILLIGIIYQYFNKPTDSLRTVVYTLYRQCARWAVAAEQDRSEIIQVLHANYATGYLWALKDIVANDTFQRITGEDFLEFEKKIVTIQDNATKRLVMKCKGLILESDKKLLKAIYTKGL